MEQIDSCDTPLSQTDISPAEGVEPPKVANVITIFLDALLLRVALSALSMSSETAYGRGERPCTRDSYLAI